MILSTLVALGLAQCTTPHERTKVSDSDPKSHCLYWREGTAIEWRANDQGNPETPGDTEFTAIEKSLATWQTQFTACGSLSLKLGPRTTSRIADYDQKAADNLNAVLWRFQACSPMVNTTDVCWKDDNCGNKFDCWQHSPRALAITTTSFDPPTGRILDADVELNTPGFIFTTVDAPVCVAPAFSQACVATDVQNTLTHEFGHSLGLAHACSRSSTMYAAADPGELGKRVLDDGSKLFVCEVYPKGAPARDCIIKTFNGNLGKPASCAAAGEQLGWGALALLGLAGSPRRGRSRPAG